MFQEITIFLGESFRVRAIGTNVLINDEEVDIDRDDGYMNRMEATTIERYGEFFSLTFGSLRVKWTEDALTVFVTIDHDSVFIPRAKGLCGNLDHDPKSEHLLHVNSCSSFHITFWVC